MHAMSKVRGKILTEVSLLVERGFRQYNFLNTLLYMQKKWQPFNSVYHAQD